MFSTIMVSPRGKVTLAQTPAWKRWVRPRENIPRGAPMDISNLDISSLIPTAGTSDVVPLCTNDILMTVTRTIQGLRASLGAIGFSEEIDRVCRDMIQVLPYLSLSEKVKVLCAFGSLKPYTVENRLEKRYNMDARLAYHNASFYSVLVSSVDWSRFVPDFVHPLVTESDRPRRILTPVIEILRSVNMMGVRGRKEIFEIVINDLIDLISSNSINYSNKQLIELFHLNSENSKLAGFIITELNFNFSSFHENLMGDFLRLIPSTNSALSAILSRELPARNWWPGSQTNSGSGSQTCAMVIRSRLWGSWPRWGPGTSEQSGPSSGQCPALSSGCPQPRSLRQFPMQWRSATTPSGCTVGRVGVCCTGAWPTG
jgi:hypothetical protein